MECSAEDVQLLRALDRMIIRFGQDRPTGRTTLARRASLLVGIDLPFSSLLVFEELREKTMRVSELAERARMPLPSVTRQIQDLEGKGLVGRTQDEKDGRASVLHLTEEGQRVAQVLNDLRVESLMKLLDGWSRDDVDQLTTLFGRLQESMRNV
jgi:DNA-binding MarR family transcriptional regulator